MRFPRSIPWKLLLKLLAAQLFVLLVVLGLAGISFRTLVILGLTFSVVSLWMASRLVFPLGRLVVKAREGAIESSGDENLPEELVDLESALDRMRSDLRRKTDALSQEREELATLMSALSDAIIAVDLQGNPLFFNTRFALLFGGKEFGAARPRLGEIFRAPEVLEVFAKALHEGKSREIGVRLHVRNESEPRYFSMSVAPLRSEGRPVYGAVGIFHDVTELKRAEGIRIDFVANVSHELRTPLTAIKGYVDTLRHDIKAGKFEAAGKFLDVIARNTDRLMDLISDLLDLSSLESSDEGEPDRFVKTGVSTSELTERVLAQIEPRRKEKDQRIETRIETPVVHADARRVEQVLVNLLENSVKYNPPGGQIIIRWEKRKEGVFLHVKDNGPGIPPEHQSRLFERFYRVDRARSREMGGTGLGLSIVKHIMQRHGGATWVVSEAGQGAEFVCRFPND